MQKAPIFLEGLGTGEKDTVGMIAQHKSEELLFSFFLLNLCFPLLVYSSLIGFILFIAECICTTQELLREGFVVVNLPVNHLGRPHWESLKQASDFTRRAWGLHRVRLCVTLLFWLFFPCLSLSLNISPPWSLPTGPSGRNAASSLFSEQLFGTRPSVPETGGRSTHPPPNAFSLLGHTF